jgi:hypothetical protein
MRIGIDISQIVHEGTGVGNYVRNLVKALVEQDSSDEFVLFGASLRKRHIFSEYTKQLKKPVRLVTVPIPPTVLDILWNVLHILPIQWIVGKVDIFWSSDWTQPPLGGCKGITTIHDLTILRYPESFASQIVAVHKRKLKRSLSSCSMFLCDSQATYDDVVRLLHVDPKNARVVYPGFNL